MAWEEPIAPPKPLDQALFVIAQVLQCSTDRITLAAQKAIVIILNCIVILAPAPIALAAAAELR